MYQDITKKIFQTTLKTTNTFVPLLQIQKGIVQIDQRGINAIQDITEGKIYLISIDSPSSSLLQVLSEIRLERGKYRKSGIWISQLPIIQPGTYNHIFFVDIYSSSQEDKIRLQTFLVLLSTIIFVDLEGGTLPHLTTPLSQIVFSSREKDQNINKNQLKKYTSHLILYGKPIKLNDQIIRSQPQLYQCLNQRHIYNNSIQLYKDIGLLSLGADILQRKEHNKLQKLKSIIFSKIQKQQQNNQDLHSSPVFVSYIQKLIYYFNKNQKIEIHVCLNQISLKQGYFAYSKAFQFYQKQISLHLKDQIIPDIQILLSKNRKNCFEQYQKHSHDKAYYLRLQKSITKKQFEIIQQNNILHDEKSIDYLKGQTQYILNKINRQNLKEQEALRLVQKMSQQYKLKAQGPRKYQLLADCLKKIQPSIYTTINSRNQKTYKSTIEQQQKKKKQLQDKIQNLQAAARRNNEKCCVIY